MKEFANLDAAMKLHVKIMNTVTITCTNVILLVVMQTAVTILSALHQITDNTVHVLKDSFLKEMLVADRRRRMISLTIETARCTVEFMENAYSKTAQSFVSVIF
jgi:hypothetical protein